MMHTRLIAVLLSIILLFSGCGKTDTAEDALEIWMLDVGNADCFLLRQGEVTMLIDAGLPANADQIVSFIGSHGIDRLDYVLLTHPHADHIGSMQRVLLSVDIGMYLYIDVPEELVSKTLLHERTQVVLDERRINTRDVSSGVTFSLGEAQVEIYPLLDVFDQLNDYSAMCRVTYGETGILFTGDAGEAAQEALLSSGYDIAADVIKLPHHGGDDAANRAFLKTVSPSYALISCGADNQNGHPSAATMELLAALGITPYRSDLCGNVCVTFTQDDIIFKTETEK